MASASTSPAPSLVDAVIDRGLLPDSLMRLAIRRIVSGRLREQEAGGIDAQSARFAALTQAFAVSPIAVETGAANAQHYEVPPPFFELVLGPHMKYSSAYWRDDCHTLGDAERAMLDLTIERAGLHDGQCVLDLGCGWGSLTLYAAERFPHSAFVAVSNSAPQRAFIERRAASRGLGNVFVITADAAAFHTDVRFDRIVTVEMLEHVRNHAALFARMANWLVPDGAVFAHVFAHRRFAYLFDDRGPADWMARHFFTGGMMPSDDLFLHLQRELVVEGHWQISGTHYQKTADAWLRNLDARRDAAERVFAAAHGEAEARRIVARWRVFFMACAEMFGYARGQEWMVSHYLFRGRQ